MSITSLGTMSDNYNYKNESVICLKKGIKAYKDKKLTGITDEDKEEIKARISAYVKENPIITQADREELENFIKNLLSEFGFKGDIDSYLFGVLGEENPSQVGTSKEFSTYLFQRETLGTMGIRDRLNFKAE